MLTDINQPDPPSHPAQGRLIIANYFHGNLICVRQFLVAARK